MPKSVLGRWITSILFLLVPAGASAQTLERDLHDAFAALKLGEARVAYQVIDAETEEILADHNSRLALIPASNMKLLTTGCALDILGPGFEFKTELILEGDRLWIRGSGDPALFDPELLSRMTPSRTVGELVDALAGEVARAGAGTLREIVVDDRVFDRTRVHPTWPANQLNRWYCAEVGGVNFHANILHVFVKPGAGSGPPQVRTQPEAPWIELKNQAKTVATGQNSVWLAREALANRFTLFGNVRFASQEPIDVTVHDPGMFFGRLMAERLAAAGVGVADGAVRLADPDERPGARARTVGIVTTPLREVVRRCNTDSHNLYAEALFKRIAFEVTGQSGSWDSGATVMRMALSEHLGPSFVSSTQIADGSGMSRENKVSPATIAHFLARMQSHPEVGVLFVESLAEPGAGTLDDRFRDARLTHVVRAKTGYISGVRAISGFVTDPATGRRLAFSILMNDVTGDPAAGNARKLQEQAVIVIDRWMSRTALATEPAIGG